MNRESTCPECDGAGTFRNRDGRLAACFKCRNAGVLVEDSAYNHLIEDGPLSHPVWDGICTGCAGSGCDSCRNTGRRYRQLSREIGHLVPLKPARKPLAKEVGEPGKERKEA